MRSAERSGKGPVEDEQDILLAPEIGQADPATSIVGQAEVGGNLVKGYAWHFHSPSIRGIILRCRSIVNSLYISVWHLLLCARASIEKYFIYRTHATADTSAAPVRRGLPARLYRPAALLMTVAFAVVGLLALGVLVLYRGVRCEGR
jgi:hypothetical protein